MLIITASGNFLQHRPHEDFLLLHFKPAAETADRLCVILQICRNIQLYILIELFSLQTAEKQPDFFCQQFILIVAAELLDRPLQVGCMDASPDDDRIVRIQRKILAILFTVDALGIVTQLSSSSSTPAVKSQ